MELKCTVLERNGRWCLQYKDPRDGTWRQHRVPRAEACDRGQASAYAETWYAEFLANCALVVPSSNVDPITLECGGRLVRAGLYVRGVAVVNASAEFSTPRLPNFCVQCSHIMEPVVGLDRRRYCSVACSEQALLARRRARR